MDSVAAVYAPGNGTSALYVSSASSSSRAGYLHTVFGTLAAASGGQLTYTDAVPLAAGDVSGVGIMFYGLPLLLVGLITSIVLLQFGMWSLGKKAVTIAATGAFATTFTFVLAVNLSVVPSDGWLLLFGFLLTQAIGWLTTAAALFAKQFFMPVAMTFVLILGIPSAGATVNGDMLPGPVRWLNSFLPFAQFVDITRSSAYFGGHGLLRPLLILLAWTVTGAALLVLALVRSRAAARASAATLDTRRSPGAGTARVHGTVSTTSGAPLGGARVLVLAEAGLEVGRTITAESGLYAVEALHPGLHHVIVSASHCEPEIATVDLRSGDASPARDFELQSWSDAAGNLTGTEISSRRDTRTR